MKGFPSNRIGSGRRHPAIFWVGMAAMILVVSGCTMVGPDYVKPTVPEPVEWMASDNPEIVSREADLSRWWMVFNDPVLNTLVESAYQQNLNLQIAGLRILEARAQLGIAVGFQFPQNQQAIGSATINQLSDNAPNVASVDQNFAGYDIGFDAAWELDVWGKFRRGVQTGVANLQASIANYDDILVSLTAEVARTYIILRITEERLAVARQNVVLQQRSFEIAQVRFKVGVVTELDVAQAKSLLRGTEATIPLFEFSIRQAKNGLAILLGKLPGEIDAMLDGAGTISMVPAEVAVGIPAELLRRRPDIRFAERRLAAQSAQIGFAKADLFPHFSLFGSIGWGTSSSVDGRSNNADFSDLFSSSSLFYTVGPAFTWDIFNYGRITNNVRVQDALFQQLAVNYENTVLRAVQEVEDAMTGFLSSQQSVVLLNDAVDASKRSVDLSLLQYREGIVDYQRVIDSQRFLTQQQDALVSTSGDVDLNLVAMYKALGGGWQISEGKAVVSDDIKEEMIKRTNWGDLMSTEQPEYPPSQDVRGVVHQPSW